MTGRAGAKHARQRVRLAAVATAAFGLILSTPGGLSWADPTEETPAASTARSAYAEGKQAVEARDWTTAIRWLSKAALQDDRNPDVHNLLGYAYRHTRQLDLAFKHYEWALQLNPRHRGAHEYVGEAYLLVGNLEKAEAHLGALKTICLIPCEEYEDLKSAISEYRQRTGK